MLSTLLYIFIIFSLGWWIQSDYQISANILILRRNKGEELEEWLKKFSWGGARDLQSIPPFPKYKFYSGVVEVILGLARRVGGSYQEAILFLREGLQNDQQFEKKIREAVLGTWFQMLLMVALTWAFIVASLHIVDIKLSTIKLVAIFLWQFMGLVSLPLLLKYFRQRLFGDLGTLWRILYILRSLARAPMARSEIFTFAGIKDLKNVKQKNLQHLVDKLKDTCQRSLQQGGSYETEVLGLMGELRFQEKWYFELFEKRLVLIKLGLLSIFFLPSYLAFIFLLLADLLTLM